MKEFIIGKRDAGQRMDKYIGKILSEAPKSFLYKMMRKKNIVLNDKKAVGKEILGEKDCIRFYLSDETFDKFRKPDFQKVTHQLDVVYENAQLLLVNKPPGTLSQKGSADDVSLVEEITSYLMDSGALTEEDMRSFRPGVCNRLDRNTSGIVVAGKTLPALQELSEMFKKRSLHKYYLAVTKGVMKEKQQISGYLTKDSRTNKVRITEEKGDESQPIETAYEPICHNEQYTLCKVELITGRSHQIRAHLASISHPIIGDGKYGDERMNKEVRKQYGITHQMLHAWELIFPKDSPEILGVAGRSFACELPEQFCHMIHNEFNMTRERLRTHLTYEVS